MKMMHSLALCAGLGAAVAYVGCGGQSPASPQVVPGLKYVNPASSGYRLVSNPESTSQRLVLDLKGPEGERIQGISLALSLDGQKAAWEGTVQEGAALDLGTGLRLMKAKAERGNLDLGLFQKGREAALLGQAPIAHLALALQPSAPKGPLALSAAQAEVLNAEGRTVTVSVATGTLSVD